MVDDADRLRQGMRMLSAAVTVFAEATTDHERLLPLVARSCGKTLDAVCQILLLGEDGHLHTHGVWGPNPEHTVRIAENAREPIRAGEPSSAWSVLATGTPVFAPSLDLVAFEGRTSPRSVATLRDVGASSLLVVPLRVRATPLGVLVVLVCGTGRAPLDTLDLELAQDLANHAALAISNSRLVAALRDSEALRTSQQETIRATRLVDAILEALPSMVFVKDADKLAFTRFNKAGEDLLGMSRSELIGKTDYDFFPPDEAAFFQEKDRETLAGKVVVDIPEEPIQTRAGARWLHTRKVPILDENGVPTHLLGISHDITDRKRGDDELRAAKELAEASSNELEAFSYSVAHDLRAPLRGIDGFAQALLEDYGDRIEETGRRYITRVREAAQRMAVLIDDLLALSRVTRAELACERVDVSALAHAVVGRLQRAEPGRSVDVKIQPGLVAAADPRLLSIALDNLFANAWKFTARTSVARIELGAIDSKSFFIRDNGAGFDMQYASKLFGVFQRLHAESEFTGTGIGLATVQRIIHRHRGKVWAEGEVGRGATFHFTLSATEDG